MSDKADVEPCPFCGSTRIEVVACYMSRTLMCGDDKVGIVDSKKDFDQVRCKFCGANGPISDGHPEDCIWSWNRVARTIRLYEPGFATGSTISIDTGEEGTRRTKTKWIRVAEARTH